MNQLRARDGENRREMCEGVDGSQVEEPSSSMTKPVFNLLFCSKLRLHLAQPQGSAM